MRHIESHFWHGQQAAQAGEVKFVEVDGKTEQPADIGAKNAQEKDACKLLDLFEAPHCAQRHPARDCCFPPHLPFPDVVIQTAKPHFLPAPTHIRLLPSPRPLHHAVQHWHTCVQAIPFQHFQMPSPQFFCEDLAQAH